MQLYRVDQVYLTFEPTAPNWIQNLDLTIDFSAAGSYTTDKLSHQKTSHRVGMSKSMDRTESAEQINNVLEHLAGLERDSTAECHAIEIRASARQLGMTGEELFTLYLEKYGENAFMYERRTFSYEELYDEVRNQCKNLDE